MEGVAEADAGIGGDGFECLGIGGGLGENHGDAAALEVGDEFGEGGGVGHLFAVHALDGEGFEAMFLAKIAEGGVGGGEDAAVAGDAGDFLADPDFEGIEALAVIGGAGGEGGLGGGIEGGQFFFHDADGAADEIDGMPPVGIGGVFVIVMMVVVGIAAAALDGGEVVADFDDAGVCREEGGEGFEVGFEAGA